MILRHSQDTDTHIRHLLVKEMQNHQPLYQHTVEYFKNEIFLFNYLGGTYTNAGRGANKHVGRQEGCGGRDHLAAAQMKCRFQGQEKPQAQEYSLPH